MIAFSTAAQKLLRRRQGLEMVFRVTIFVNESPMGFEVDVDLTPDVKSIGALRNSIRPFTRETEIGQVSITLDNSRRQYSPYNDRPSGGMSGEWVDDGSQTSIFVNRPYHGSKVVVYGGVRFDDTTVEVVPIFTGILDYVELDSSDDQELAILKVDDVLSLLKVPGVGDHVNDAAFADNSPAGLAYKLLGPDYANIPTEFIDIPSFTLAASAERTSGYLCKDFTLQEGTWYDNISRLLAHGAAGLRVTGAGKLQYFTYRPGSGQPDMTLYPGEHFSRIRFRESATNIRNRIVVQRTDTGALADTALSPISYQDSIDEYGEKNDSRLSLDLYQSDAPADQVARKNLSVKAWPLGEYDIDAHIACMALEVGDTVRLYDPSFFQVGYNVLDPFKDMVVVERELDEAQDQVRLKAVDFNVEQKCYIYLDRGIELDSGCFFY